MTIHMHTMPGANPEHPSVHYAAFAETTATPSVDRALAKLLRIRADLTDPGVKTSDAATTGMLLAEEQALLELAMTPTGTAEEFETKLAAVQGELAREDIRRSTSLLATALVADFRKLMNTI